jgi:histidine ammonia-lyase
LALTPQVPQFGSVGASGDLAPLAHIALALIGEGPFTNAKGRTYSNLSQLRGAKPKALQLQMKEGLALVNGVQFSTAYALLALQQCKLLLNQAIINSALVTQVMLGSDGPFAEDFQSLRPHPGALLVAKKLRALLTQSPIRNFHRDSKVDGEIQDPYNIRCTPQILGACHELLTTCEETLLIESSSVTDNPLMLGQKFKGKTKYTRIVSGGHFHGMPVAIQLYHLLEMMGIVARLSNMRCVRFVDESKNRGLGSALKWPDLSADELSASSGMMIPEYVSAALCNQIWGQAMPTHLFSLSTDAGQEDHVSMSAGLAVRVWDTLPRLAEVLAIEFAYCLQAVAIRHKSEYFPGENGKLPWPKQSRRLSRISEQIVKAAWASFPPVTKDRPLSSGIKKLAQEIAEGRYAQIAHRQL